ncbi:MAG: hypothetical protein A2007_01255 [Verrucomicrobia bacterium GWC2_42_7]|nr:MAG: hypothetical protein A2007_01255 [Verrucomicrobia bacterium GWC2_42_7]
MRKFILLLLSNVKSRGFLLFLSTAICCHLSIANLSDLDEALNESLNADSSWSKAESFGAERYQKFRNVLRTYGIERFKEDLIKQGVFSRDGNILPAKVPFNAFARILSGDLIPNYSLTELVNYGMEEEQKRYLLAGNKPELDENWNSTEAAYLGKASMSKMHKFLIPRNPGWHTFNILTFGLKGDNYDIKTLQEDIRLLQDMKRTAIAYAQKKDPTLTEENIILCFHVYPLNSVHWLHMHILDRRYLGPTYLKLKQKNLFIDDAIAVLQSELLVHYSESH